MVCIWDLFHYHFQNQWPRKPLSNEFPQFGSQTVKNERHYIESPENSRGICRKVPLRENMTSPPFHFQRFIFEFNSQAREVSLWRARFCILLLGVALIQWLKLSIVVPSRRFDPRHATLRLALFRTNESELCYIFTYLSTHTRTTWSIVIRMVKKLTRGSWSEPGLCLTHSLRKPDVWGSRRMDFEWCQHE